MHFSKYNIFGKQIKMNAVEEGKEAQTKLLRNERQIKVQMQIKVRCIRLIKGQLVKRIEPNRQRERGRRSKGN